MEQIKNQMYQQPLLLHQFILQPIILYEDGYYL